MNVTQKIAIVTGASSGLGAAISTKLVENGVQVYGLARNVEKLQELKANLGSMFISVAIDITNREAIKDWLSNAFLDRTPHILINNAGVGIFGKIDEMNNEDWDAMVNTNLNGMYNITSEVIKLLKPSQEPAHIINIGSILGRIGRAESAGYCATKFAIQGFSDALFMELRHFNIKVTCFNPGSMDTHFFESSGISSHNNMLQPNDLAETVLHVLQTPDNMLISEITIRPLNPKSPD